MRSAERSLGHYETPLLVGVVVGVSLRISNAIWYPLHYGFDATENWRYIERLTRSWALPSPDADWATAHPPLFYYVGAAIARVLEDPGLATLAMRLLGTCSGLAIAWLAFALVRRVAPDNARQAFLAPCLLLFLPAHIYMSAMLSEELFAALFASIAITAVAMHLSTRDDAFGARSLVAAGAVAGLGLLTKLSAAITIGAGSLAYLLRDALREKLQRGLARAVIFGLAASLVGGGFYLRNLLEYGSPYPQSLPTHSLMFEMPPGERGLLDYLHIPLATFDNPRMDSPDLLRSVWGATYASLWYDAHRHFLPSAGEGVRRLGTAILILALVPSFAFFHGVFRGFRRLFSATSPTGAGADLPLLLLVVGTLVGYAFFTWRNPWFPVVKGSYLLGLCVPFAFYASEALAIWTSALSRPIRETSGLQRALALAVWIVLGALVTLVVIGFWQGLVFSKVDAPGFVRWRSAA